MVEMERMRKRNSLLGKIEQSQTLCRMAHM